MVGHHCSLLQSEFGSHFEDAGLLNPWRPSWHQSGVCGCADMVSVTATVLHRWRPPVPGARCNTELVLLVNNLQVPSFAIRQSQLLWPAWPAEHSSDCATQQLHKEVSGTRLMALQVYARCSRLSTATMKPSHTSLHLMGCHRSGGTC